MEWVILLACIGGVVGLVPLNCEYSSVSGLVSQVVLDGHVVPIAFDFNSQESWLYDESTFPPFVTDCLRRDPYSPVQDVEEPFTLERDWGFLSGFKKRVQLANALYRNYFVFGIADHAKPKSPRFRDVAGALGLARSSPLVQDQCLSFSDKAGDDVPGLRIRSCSPHEGFHVSESTASDTQWSFSSKIRVGPVEITDTPVRIVFDPNVETLIFPMEWRARFLQSLPVVYRATIGSQNELQVDFSARLELSLIIGESRIVSLQNVLLYLTSDLVKSGFPPLDPGLMLARTRIRFSSSVTDITIGRILIRSVDRIDLDFRLKQLRIAIGQPDREKNLLRLLYSGVPQVPLFDEPTIMYRKDSLRIQFEPAVSGSGLMLVSTEPARRGKGNDVVRTYTFFHVPGKRQERSLQRTPVSGKWSDLKIDWEYRNIVISATSGGETEILLKSTGRIYQISIRETEKSTSRTRSTTRRNPEQFELVTSSSGTNRIGEACQVCMEMFHKGDGVIRIPGCSHACHATCVDTAACCPVCGTVIDEPEEGQFVVFPTRGQCCVIA